MNAAALSSDSLWRRQWFLAGLSLFFLAITLQYYFKVHASDRETRSAFKRWQPQILEIDEGVDIWAKFTYPNPPIMVLILKPLADLAPLAGSMAWFFLKVLMTLLAIHWVLSMVESPERPFPVWAKVLAVLLSLRPIQGDLVHGNVNLFILFLVVACLYAWTKKQDVLAGLALALAIACKVTPALFLPYFIWKRSWKTLAGTAVGLGLFLWVIPSLFLGWDANARGLHSWYRNMIVPFVAKGEVTTEHINQSVPGLAHRLLTHSPSFFDWKDNVEMINIRYHNVANLEARTVGWLVKGIMLAFGLMVLWCCRTPAGDRSHWLLTAEFGIIVLGMLLFSERTWKHHCVTLLIPFAVASYALAIRWNDRVSRYVLLGCLAVSTILMSLTGKGISDTQERIGDLAQVYGAYVWAFVVLVAAMVVVLKRQPPGERGGVAAA